MHKRLSLLIFGVVFFIQGESQLSVSLQQPPSGIVQKNQLWNMALINTGNNTLTVTIGLSLVDMSDNQTVFTAFTRPVVTSKGVKQLKATDVGPVQYNYTTTAFSRQNETFLPVGNYRACYTVYTDSKSAEGVLTEDCMNIDVEPLSPPQLVTPADSDKVQTPYPQFGWLAPAPVTLFNDLNYDLLLVEVREGQTAEKAIQENIPVMNMRRLASTILGYPSSAKSLDTGKIYAWKIIANNNESPVSQSEIWTFKIKRENPEVLTPAGGLYVELKNDNNFGSTAIIPDNILGIKYYSYDKTRDASVRFINSRGEVVKEIIRKVEYGNNFLVFKLDNSFVKEEVYSIEINDLQMSHYQALFRISK